MTVCTDIRRSSGTFYAVSLNVTVRILRSWCVRAVLQVNGDLEVTSSKRYRL